MSTISSSAGLSKNYTAHIIRLTVISELFQAGFSLPNICKITGHKQTRTVERYLQYGSRKISQMKDMCLSLKRSLHSSKGDENAENEEEITCMVKRKPEYLVEEVQNEEMPQQRLPTAVLEKNGAKLMFFL